VKGGYHETRLVADRKRTIVWQALWRYHFRHEIGESDSVLDLGSGHGDFINAVTAKRRIAIDTWPGLVERLAAGIEAITTTVTDLSAIDDDSIDYAFASNLFEHLTHAQLDLVLQQLERKLTHRGKLTLLQPNYRYAYREYFDDYTHVTAFSHVSLTDFLRSRGWEILVSKPRFLPLTIKSRLPTSTQLIRLYLKLPFKPFAKQMLLVAKPTRTRESGR